MTTKRKMAPLQGSMVLMLCFGLSGCGLSGWDPTPTPADPPISGARTQVTFTGSLGEYSGSVGVQSRMSHASASKRVEAGSGPEAVADALYEAAKQVGITARRDGGTVVTLKNQEPTWIVTVFNASAVTTRSWNDQNQEITTPAGAVAQH